MKKCNYCNERIPKKGDKNFIEFKYYHKWCSDICEEKEKSRIEKEDSIFTYITLGWGILFLISMSLEGVHTDSVFKWPLLTIILGFILLIIYAWFCLRRYYNIDNSDLFDGCEWGGWGNFGANRK